MEGLWLLWYGALIENMFSTNSSGCDAIKACVEIWLSNWLLDESKPRQNNKTNPGQIRQYKNHQMRVHNTLERNESRDIAIIPASRWPCQSRWRRARACAPWCPTTARRRRSGQPPSPPSPIQSKIPQHLHKPPIKTGKSRSAPTRASEQREIARPPGARRQLGTR